MSRLKTIQIKSWDQPISKELQAEAVQALEQGKVLYFPNLEFPLDGSELRFLSPHIMGPKAKNISYDPKSNRVGGSCCTGLDAEHLKDMIHRYSTQSRHFLESLIPHYTSHLSEGKTSFRPVEISGRKTSYRKDDTRLHIDAFPSNPTKGRRILRVFTNINNENKPRVWRIGEPLQDVFEKFLPKASSPMRGVASILKWLGITKDYRTPYDHYMLQIHDRMKRDKHYQETVSQETIKFPPGSTWIVFTDQVSHAAMSGQHVLEQTFHLPYHGLKVESTAPLRVMERLLNKKLT